MKESALERIQSVKSAGERGGGGGASISKW